MNRARCSELLSEYNKIWAVPSRPTVTRGRSPIYSSALSFVYGICIIYLKLLLCIFNNIVDTSLRTVVLPLLLLFKNVYDILKCTKRPREDTFISFLDKKCIISLPIIIPAVCV